MQQCAMTYSIKVETVRQLVTKRNHKPNSKSLSHTNPLISTFSENSLPSKKSNTWFEKSCYCKIHKKKKNHVDYYWISFCNS